MLNKTDLFDEFHPDSYNNRLIATKRIIIDAMKTGNYSCSIPCHIMNYRIAEDLVRNAFNVTKMDNEYYVSWEDKKINQ